MAELQVLSAIELIRRRPTMFFEGGVPTANELLSLVMKDLGEERGFSASVYRAGQFSMVCADVDWMKSNNASFDQLFDRFVLPNSNRPNTHRAEVLLVAVCQGMLTVGQGGAFSRDLQMTEVPEEFARAAKIATRALIWKFAE